ncbi:MAG: 3-beta hydroxysteroid dehydrogenase [Verrucomicrobiota bacterium]
MPTPLQTCLVTGASGFLGRVIARQLASRGARVIAYGRSSPDALLREGAATWIRGELDDAEALSRACDGVDTVFHVAAKAGVWGAYEDYFRPNVLGTRAVIQACRQALVPRLVFTSSPSVAYDDSGVEGGDESLPYPAQYLTHYPATKAQAEREVLAANSPELATCALRPHLIWGPEDGNLLPRLIARAKAGKLIQVGDGSNRVDVSYVDNAACAHIQAALALALASTGAPAGKAYFIGDAEPVLLWPWINRLLTELKLPPVKRRISYPAARLLGRGCELAWSLGRLKGEPPMTRFVAAQLATSHWFRHDAASRDFGYAPAIDNEEGLRRTVNFELRVKS